MKNTITITTQQNFYGIDTDILLKLVQDINPKITNITHEILNYTYSDRSNIEIKMAKDNQHKGAIITAINEFFHYSADSENKELMNAHKNEFARRDIVNALRKYLKPRPRIIFDDDSLVISGDKYLNRNIRNILNMGVKNFEIPHEEFFYDVCEKLFTRDSSYDDWSFASQENDGDFRINIKKLVENILWYFIDAVNPVLVYETNHESTHDDKYDIKIIDIINEIHLGEGV